MNYYNEHDPHAAQWLRNLIAAGHVPFGYVDERSIEDVEPSELAGYTQCHFFAGIGGWSLALQLAGWPADRSVWTGSCPCQPFSAAGSGAGFADERHLWPAWFHLIEQCRPVTVFGEQVEAAIRHDWLDLVHADLEGAGYTVGAACLPAAAVGAPHQRQRLWWGADSKLSERRAIDVDRQDGRDGPNAGRQETHGEPRSCGEIYGMADSAARGLGIDGSAPRNPGHVAQCDTNDMDGSERTGLGGYRPDQGQGGRIGTARPVTAAGALDAWRDLEWLPCSDGKARPTQPGLFPLAYGVPGRVGRLRAYGNAIVPQVGSAFVAAYLGLTP